MNLRGVPLFLLVAWLSTGILALVLWRKVPGTNPYVAYLLVLAAAFLPVVFAWAFALHGLYWREKATMLNLWIWGRDAVILGGLFTGAYWLPASVINYFVLRRRAA